jgi:hypothetical protein
VKPLALAAITAAATLLWTALPASDLRASSSPPSPIPLLDCADVNGDSSVTSGDIAQVIGKFGATTASAGYALLYDVGSPVGTISAGDLAAAVLDFGDSNDGDGDVDDGDTCPEVDTQIAQATLWVIRDHPEFLTLNVATLEAAGFFSTQIVAPGQGLHFGRTGSRDGTFELFPPDALVYKNGTPGAPLIAQLYYVEANPDEGGVGWGPVEPPQVDQANIDEFCLPPIGETACSWADDEDGWHWHANLCFQHIGTTQEIALPGSDEACPDEDDSNCPLDQGQPTDCNQFRPRTGWMGHLYNHLANRNGRFADCFPDTAGWKAFNCPQ